MTTAPGSGSPINCLEATVQRLPDLVVNSNCTFSESRGGLYYKGPLNIWTTFEEEVRNNLRTLRENRNTEFSQILMYQEPTFHNDSRRCGGEVVAVGNEIGVSGRLTQHVGHVTTCIAQCLGLPIRFGDWRTSRDAPDQKKKLPDVTYMGKFDDPRIVGEIKTPWTGVLDDILGGGIHPGFRLRKITGQVASYMQQYKLKYAFLSTYEMTIFYKEQVMDNNDIGLVVSRVIYHSTPSNLSDGESATGHVSLRECMLYFMCLVAQDEGSWRSQQKRKAAWIDPHGPKSDSSMGQPSGGGPKTRSTSGYDAGKAPDRSAQPGPSSYGNRRTHDYDQSLHDQLQTLSLGSSTHYDPGPIKVKARDGNYWYKPSSNTVAQVEDSRWEDGRLLVKVNGQRRLATVVNNDPDQDLSNKSTKKKWYQRTLAA